MRTNAFIHSEIEYWRGSVNMSIGEKIGKADWKTEKHVPVIEAAAEVKADTMFEVKVSVGKEIAHPNTTAHHISWIQIYFLADGEKFLHQVGGFQFTAHSEGIDGADTGAVKTHHAVTVMMSTKKSGKLYALSMCNVHGLWENEKEVKVV
jgi:superoxide reductase